MNLFNNLPVILTPIYRGKNLETLPLHFVQGQGDKIINLGKKNESQ